MDTNWEQVKSDKILNDPNYLQEKSTRFTPKFNAEDHISYMKWDGWGYTDSKFVISENGSLSMSGDRYSIKGDLPYLKDFVEREMGVNTNNRCLSNAIPNDFPNPTKNMDFISQISSKYLDISFDNLDRLAHSHGQCVQEIWNLRYDSFDKLVDAVIYPTCHEDVEVVVKTANECNVVVIPYGGGTNVSRALECPVDEDRMIISLDMRKMRKILWIDRENMIACIEAGISGEQLAKSLLEYDLTTGHEPDSLEFSTLGGWISTRASGMKKNVYGNIEDLLVNLTIVTPMGTWTRNSICPRISSGPDILHIFMGHEGIFGVITQAVIKVTNLPPVRKYGSMAFPNFEQGVKFMHYVALHKFQPASIRLIDPEQFRFGQSLKSAPKSWFEDFKNKAKKFFITKIKNFDPMEMCAATVLFEGTLEKVGLQENFIYTAAKNFEAVRADEESGYRGYALTFAIAYLRDLGMELNFIAESFETSVPWSMTYTLCMRVKQKIYAAAQQIGIKVKPFVSCRVTQTYDVGSCVYFYFGFCHTGVENPINKFNFVEHAAREEIFRCGGSISHHHGVGKQRKCFIEDSIGPLGVKILGAIKSFVDPKNIFASKNIFN